MAEDNELDGPSWIETAQRPRLKYETDITKHYVRLFGWLPASNQRKSAVGGRRPLRYFTFCAASAVDVFMLEREEVIRRNVDDGVLQETYYCELEPPDFRTIGELLRSSQQGFLGRFEDIILFEDVGDTVGKTNTDPGPGKVTNALRDQLDLKDKHQRLKAAFPFDIINLDATGTLLPPREPPKSKLIKAIERMLEWQRDRRLPNGDLLDQFALFLTTRVVGIETSPEGISELVGLLQANVDSRPGFRGVWKDRLGKVTPAELAEQDFPRFFSMAIPKWLVETGRDQQCRRT